MLHFIKNSYLYIEHKCFKHKEACLTICKNTQFMSLTSKNYFKNIIITI